MVLRRKFPETLYVRREMDQDGTPHYFAVDDVQWIYESYSGARIGVYRLVEVKTFQVGEKTLE